MESNPLAMRKLNAWAMGFWAANMVAVFAVYFWANPFWQQVSILYLAQVSIYANFVSHGAWFQASNAEAHLRDDIDT
jgi:hypothetical protein